MSILLAGRCPFCFMGAPPAKLPASRRSLLATPELVARQSQGMMLFLTVYEHVHVWTLSSGDAADADYLSRESLTKGCPVNAKTYTPTYWARSVNTAIQS